MAIPSNTYQPLLSITITAGEALAAHRLVKANGTYAATTEQMIGVTEIALANAEIGVIIVAGTAIVETAATVAAGEWVAAFTGGTIKPATVGQPVFGICTVGCTGAGYASILISHQMLAKA